MRIFHSWQDLPDDARGAAVALGNFDGVHLGHATVIRAAHAALPRARLAVLTFEPHPREFFRPEDPPFRLTLPAEKYAALAALGVEVAYEFAFDEAFGLMSAEAFIADVLHAGIGARHIACGPDFAFGHRRRGSVALLAARAEGLGIGLTLVPPLADAAGPLSSSRIRRHLEEGYPERAAEELGRPFSVRGVVMRGQALGRTLGFRTANMALGRHVRPARGVYAVTVRLPDGTVVPGVANLGMRPTVVEGATELRLETHIFDFEGDLYDREIAVSLHAFLRPEQKFPGLEALRAQIARDAAEARARLAGVLDHLAHPSA